jgi:Zn ribbon nucleic-acid-binding protein
MTMTDKITKTSKNTNCLEGMKCPKCGQEDTFKIAASCLFTVTDDGTQDEGNGHEWDDTNYCECSACGHHGTVADFTVEEWGKQRNLPETLPHEKKFSELFHAARDAYDQMQQCAKLLDQDQEFQDALRNLGEAIGA